LSACFLHSASQSLQNSIATFASDGRCDVRTGHGAGKRRGRDRQRGRDELAATVARPS
jgi:hypothetical protein